MVIWYIFLRFGKLGQEKSGNPVVNGPKGSTVLQPERKVKQALQKVVHFARNVAVWTWLARWYIFQQKHPNLSKFWRALEKKMLVYFTVICNI
jgi:hypothetical protein